MDYLLLHLGTSPVGLGIIAPIIESIPDAKLYFSDHSKTFTEKCRLVNLELQKEPTYFWGDKLDRGRILIRAQKFITLNALREYDELFSAAHALIISVDIPFGEQDIYLTAIIGIINKRSKKKLDSFIIFCNDSYDRELGIHIHKNSLISRLESSTQKNVIFLDSIFHTLSSSPFIYDGEIVVSRDRSPIWIVNTAELEDQKLEAFWKSLLSKVRTATDASDLARQSAEIDIYKTIISVISYFAFLDKYPFVEKYLSTHIGQKVLNKILIGTIAINKIAEQRVIDQCRLLKERLEHGRTDVIKALPWLIDPIYKPIFVEEMKTKLKFHFLKNIDFREIEIFVIFFKKLGVPLDL